MDEEAARRQKWREKGRKYWAKNAQRLKPKRQAAHRKLKYGLSEEDYSAIIQKQDGRCAICKDVLILQGRFTHVDHNHLTGVVRGLLCMWCNVGLGAFKDDSARLQQAFSYLSGV